MTSVTQPNSAAVNPLPHSKNFLEDGDKFNEETIDKMSVAIKNSDNLDQFLSSINRQNVNQSQYSEEPATAAGSPTKSGFNSARSPKTTYNMRLYDPFQYLNSSDEEECTFQPKINKNATKLTKRVYSGDTNEQLYRYATERTLKKQEFADIDAQNIYSKTLITKSDKNSVKMILKKLQTAINNLVSEVAEDGETEKGLTFEGLGTVLHRLGIFQNLAFNNGEKDGEGSSLSINYAKVKPERLTKEIVFHEQLWKICAVPALETDKIPSELVAKLLTVLVEEKTAVNEAGNFLTDIVNISLANIGLKGDGEKTAYELQKEEKGLWSLQKVVSEFRQLFDNKTNFMSIYNSKKTILTTEELSNKFYQQTHTPQVNKKSAILDARKWNPKFSARLEKHDPNLTQKDLRTRTGKLYKYSKYLQDQKNIRLETRIAEELNPCTFVPKTTKYKKPVYNRSEQSDSLSPSRLGYFSQALAEPSVANRHLMLYEVAKTYKEKLQQKSYSFKMKEESNEMAECSFKPKLNRNYENSPTRNQDFYEGVPRGFKKNVERLHLGAYIKDTREAEREKIPRGENYHKNKELDFTPPTFLQRPKIKKDEVLVYVDVSIGPGKTGRIGIHRGDNAKSLAKNFARTYSLNGTMRESLEKLLQSYIDSYFAQPAPQQEQEVVEQREEEGEERHEDEQDENGDEEESEEEEEQGQEDN